MERLSEKELELSLVEQRLKVAMLSRSNAAKKIMTAQELTDYQQWMFEQFGGEASTAQNSADLSRFPNIAKKENILRHFSRSDTERSSLSPFLMHSSITENDEILENHHIAVGRMLRYFPAHWHANDYFEIYYSLSGTCPIYFQNEIISVSPGTVLVVAPSVIHATPCYEDNQVLLYYAIRSSTFDQVFWNQIPAGSLMASFFRQALNSQHPTAYLHFETDGDADIRSYLYNIYLEYCAAQRYSAQMLSALMSAFFVLLLRRYEGSVRLPRRADFFWKHEFSAILTYIQIHYASASIKSVAEHFHYSVRQIGRIVQSCTGLTFAELTLKLRMDQAEMLLRQKGASIERISAAVGYSTPSSFFRAFGKYHGCTPGEYAARWHGKH